MDNNQIPADVLAVIALAIYELQDQVHDVESNLLTIKRPAQEYLPWCDKSETMLKMPR